MEINPPIPPITQKQQQTDQTVNQIAKQQSQTLFKNDSKFATNRNEKRTNATKQPAQNRRNKTIENTRDSTSSTSASDSDTNT